ncbi:19178_t:CDS:2 [Funneliformis geosporum]|uniref:16540_t:CDS:1 n=1 Tax=Funneliformis geosporum TaxID=1117311 RepID=A0A9W4WWY7_9GLOM|nr:19178_t:CDS:2 [Funneliformis geosporum]CAI2169750.1 16540_t:CDS:2 [Funneliformis geosporum]
MTSLRKPAKITKTIIFYNGLFHYVEDNANGEADDMQFVLFKVYNLTRSFEELRKEIIASVGGGESTTVTYIDDFKDESDEAYVSLNENVKIKICFKSQKHRDVIEHLRSSQSIKDLTQYGFADWVPLDIKSYINIERNSQCERRGNILTTTKLRSFEDDIDPRLLEMIIDEICENKIDLALEKLFPGPSIKIYHEINDHIMIAVLFEIQYHFDEEIGRLFVEVLNSLIEDRKIESRSNEASSVFSTFVYHLFTVIRNLIYLNELYGEIKFPSWTPFINHPKLKEIRDKTLIRYTSEEEDLRTMEKVINVEESLRKLNTIVKHLQDEVEIAQYRIHYNIRKWKNPKRTSSGLFYGSIAAMLTIPTMYLSNKSAARAVSSNRLKISFGCLLTIVLGIWSKNSHNNFHKAINVSKQLDPLLASTKHNIDLLDRWLDGIAADDNSKIKVNDYEFKGRKVILKQLFHQFVVANAIIKTSFSIAS